MEDLDLLAESSRRYEVAPLDYETDTEAQARWLAFGGKLQLWRAANQVGKSRAQAKKALHMIRRTGPFANRPPGPVRVLVISISKEQMEPLHAKFWELLPKEEVDPSVNFRPGFGFVGKPARVVFDRGPGAGSLIMFATYSQGANRIEGGTWDVIILDEPPPEEMWSAVTSRLLHGRPGELWITFTATPQSPDLTYLRQKVDAGEVREMQTSLTVKAVTRTDGVRLLSQAKVDAFVAACLPIERDMRVHGGWDIVQTERYLPGWGSHCIEDTPPPPGATLCVGLDHGTGAGKQAAALVAVYQPERELHPRVWVLEEYRADGFSTPEMDAIGIMEMLGRRGFGYDDVDKWWGDRATGMDKHDIAKSNKLIRVELARLMGRRDSDPRMKRIEVPYKRTGSVLWGFRMLNAMMARGATDGSPHFRVASHLTEFPLAAGKWRGESKSPLKDILDAVRYPVESEVRVGAWFPFHDYKLFTS